MTQTITFRKTNDDLPISFTVSGNIVVQVYRVASPQLDGQFTVGGNLSVVIPGPKTVRPLAGQYHVSGDLKAGIKVPNGAFKDFAHFPYAGVDPTMAMIGITSGALNSGATGTYTRPYAAFTGPQDYQVSGGGYAWKRAAYASVGFKFAGMQANKHQVLDAVQFEPLPLSGTGPSAYTTARSLQVVVKPTRLNYATNPNMESGITGYSAGGTATVGSDSSFWWKGTKSLKVTVPSGATQDGGMAWNISGLIPGRQYTMSARVAVAVGCGEVWAWSASVGSIQGAQVSFAQAEPDTNNPRWRTVAVTFTATETTTSLGINVAHATMTAGISSIFWVDGVLVEEGTAIRPYFDGSMGVDYLWESGGTANLSRTYFYENRIERSYLIQTLLAENTPLGITSAVPLYAVLPTQ